MTALGESPEREESTPEAPGRLPSKPTPAEQTTAIMRAFNPMGQTVAIARAFEHMQPTAVFMRAFDPMGQTVAIARAFERMQPAAGFLQAFEGKLTQGLVGPGFTGGAVMYRPERSSPRQVPSNTEAARLAKVANTVTEFGQALEMLRQDRRMSLLAVVQAGGEKYLSKPTVSRACRGLSLFREEAQVRAFVRGCAATHEVQVWVEAWRRVREADRARRRESRADPQPGEQRLLEADAATDVQATDERPRGDRVPGNDEVATVLQIPVTYGQLRAASTASAAVVAGALMLLASDAIDPKTGLIVTVVGLSAALALDRYSRCAATDTRVAC